MTTATSVIILAASVWLGLGILAAAFAFGMVIKKTIAEPHPKKALRKN